MAKFFFHGNVTDIISGTPGPDKFIARSYGAIEENDVILNYQAKDRIDLPGDWRGKNGNPCRLTRPVFTHDLDTQGGVDGLISRLEDMPKNIIATVKVRSSVEGWSSTLLLENDRRKGWDPWVDGSILLQDYSICKLNPVSII